MASLPEVKTTIVAETVHGRRMSKMESQCHSFRICSATGRRNEYDVISNHLDDRVL